MAYVKLNNLTIYQLSRDYSEEVWQIYSQLNWRDKKTMGDQFIRSVDSIGANIAEGYGRYHYLDKIKFYYNARGSLLESKHWLDLLRERSFIDNKKYQLLLNIYNNIFLGLNCLIRANYQSKKVKQ
jgi:four helix bundle protein